MLAGENRGYSWNPNYDRPWAISFWRFSQIAGLILTRSSNGRNVGKAETDIGNKKKKKDFVRHVEYSFIVLFNECRPDYWHDGIGNYEMAICTADRLWRASPPPSHPESEYLYPKINILT